MFFTFTLRMLTGYISPGAMPVYDRRWSCMMEKAGYLQQTRCRAFDGDGREHEVVELHVLGNRYAIRKTELLRAVSGRSYIQIEELTRNWNYYLGLTRGLAHVSASGKALNIDLFEAGTFTLSLATLRAVIYGKERMAVIVKIPESPAARIRRVVEGQQKISATV
jgi:hypothetical protein